MKCLVASEADEASRNQREALLHLVSWNAEGRFGGRPVHTHGPWTLVSIPELHLDRDHLDRDLEAELGGRVELIVYLSKHRSESGRPSLTVHPIGNLHAAELGGQPQTLVPTAPGWMTAALRSLALEARNLPYEVTFEATHHGPFLETPAFFIEQGSTTREWADREASAAIARALVSLEPLEAPIAIGVGGGHYVPRHTDLALRRNIAFGHLLPSYGLKDLAPAVLNQAVERTPGASLVYIHRKSFAGAVASSLSEAFAVRGLRVVREADLEPNNPAKTS